MGSGCSRILHVSSNESVNRFVSPEPLEPGHPFWNGFLSFQLKIPRTRKEWKELHQISEELLKRLAINNLKSGNFGFLLEVFLTRATELKSSIETDSSLFLWQTFNALFVIRVCIKFFVERLKEEDVLRQFSAKPSRKANDSDAASRVDPEKRYRMFLSELVDLVANVPNTDLTYGLLCESINTLVILLSPPLFASQHKPYFQLQCFRTIFDIEDEALIHRFIHCLLKNFVEQKVAPAAYINADGGGLVLGLASGVWNILTLGYNSVVAKNDPDAHHSHGDNDGNVKTSLADSSLLLLLILANHCPDQSMINNPYRRSLFICSNSVKAKGNDEGKVSHEKSVDDKAVSPAVDTSFETDFGALFKTICDTLHRDESTLLLYLLLHQNHYFKTHVLASSDMEKIVLPILKTLYFATESSNHHIYMSLIVLLILSEDDLFNASVHNIMIKSVEWYTERTLQEISLGGLLILVVIRTIQYNMLKMRDKYLHTNCLAALANMSGHFKNLHPYVSQRIVSMFEALAKKHGRMVSTLRQTKGKEGVEEDSVITEALSDVAVLEEVLRMILEIINSCLVNQIKSNSNLIYTLLYKREVFEPFLSNPNFQDISQNLQTVIVFFNSKLEQNQEKKDRILSVEEVQDVIRQSALQFPREKLIKFPDLKFKYVEEEQPEDFFVPYVWTMAAKKFYWSPQHVKLIAIDKSLE